MAKSFSAQVDDWIAKSERLSMAVLQQATQAVINEANTPVAKGGRMRVDTGFLRNSLKANIGSMPSGASSPGNWDDDEVVVGPGNHIFKTQEEAENALRAVHAAWGKEAEKDPKAEWLTHTDRPSLRKITWDEPVAKA